MGRLTLAVILSLCIAALALACGGDDDGGSNGEATRTPFIQPPTLSPDAAIGELEAIVEMIENPDQVTVDESGIGQFELQTRITQTIEGTPQVPGLDEVRSLLEEPDRILAREYLHNNLVEVLALPFTDADTVTISADELSEIDPLHAFVERGDSFTVSAIFRDAVLRAIELWYLI